jgi:predicted nuclease with TOPRIM domain
MAHEQDQWVTTLARIREHCDWLTDRWQDRSTWTEVQREREDLLNIVDMLAAQLAVANARVMVLKTAQLVAAEEAKKRRSEQDHPCHCKHSMEAHTHYRGGNDCAFCECHVYRPAAAALPR